MNSFSRIITLLRKEKGITQKQAAADLGISQALLSHYEKGLRECGLDFLIKLCDYYNVSSDYILGRSPDRSGAVLTVDDLEGAETVKDSHYSGSVLPAMNKRLISSSLNVVYDMLAKAGNKELTTKVSDYLMLSVYRMFRKLYRSEKKNSLSMFNVSSTLFESYTLSAMEKTSADINLLLTDKNLVKAKGDAFEMTSESIVNVYPKHAQGLLNTVKTAEDLIK
ncbi:MAG: helix-turn-helix domain-containing protein [Oscillospiraceae bacterium]|nr:helix-turn-helix domain-containing protein [Oscillospiraceae bacterium]MBQ6849864.1 helix-turn-helix domain-containing protein [Oscillospiraceae bacterium]MBR6608888.1 helix-turn-helix domain-containing protein [Oscillospiraceae bacterium]